MGRLIFSFAFVFKLFLSIKAFLSFRRTATGPWRWLIHLAFLLTLALGVLTYNQISNTEDKARPGEASGHNSEIEGIDGNQNIVFEENTFGAQLMLIYQYLDDYAGSTVEIQGLLYRDENFPEAFYAVARYLVSCCLDDAEAIGLYFQYDGLDAGIDDWIMVSGTLGKGEINGEVVPLIQAREVVIIPPLESKYINF